MPRLKRNNRIHTCVRPIAIAVIIGCLVAAFMSGCEPGDTSGCDGTDTGDHIVTMSADTLMNTPVQITLPLDDQSTCDDSGRISTQAQYGAVTGVAPDLQYSPQQDYLGTDSFSFVIQCDITTTFEIRVTVSEQPTDDPPPDDEPTGQEDWLRTQGNRIVDSNGRTVWLTGANWFGFNCHERILHGLWTVHLETMIRDISRRGINILRLPISTQLLAEWMSGQPPEPVGINYYANPELEGLNTLEIFDLCLSFCEKYGLKVMLDVHSAEANNSGHVFNMWYTESISAQTFFDTWEWVADRYKNNDTLVAFDLENEPHGKPNEVPRAKWDDSTDADNWKYACEQAAKRILAKNPNVLILCEGIEVYPMSGANWSTIDEKKYYGMWWGGNLRGVADHPVDLGAHQDQLLYSPHDYGPSVWPQAWFEGDFSIQSLYTDVWYPNWFFIQEENIAPLLIGEWGGHMDGGDNEKWMVCLRDFMIQNHIHHTFWCINPNSGDTGGLIGYDWVTWDEEKYGLLKPALWQTSNGKFVGLDHDIPLGGPDSTTGVSLNAFYSTGGTAPNP